MKERTASERIEEIEYELKRRIAGAGTWDNPIATAYLDGLKKALQIVKDNAEVKG